jgi:hypothetical protein
MAPLPMRWLIEKVVRFPRAETVRLTGPTELDLTEPEQATFVICNHTIEQDHRGVKRVTRPHARVQDLCISSSNSRWHGTDAYTS